MREFLLTACPIFLWVIMAFHLIFFVLLRRRFMDTKSILFLLAAIVTFGLLFDSMILAFGTFMDAESLAGASRFRIVSQGALMPLIYAICIYALNEKPLVRRILSIFTLAMVVAGIAGAFATVLEPRQVAGVTLYEAGAGTPAWASAVGYSLTLGTSILLSITGIVVMRRQNTPTLMLAGELMLLFTLLGPITGNADLSFFLQLIGAVLMVLFFYAYGEIRLYNEYMESK